MLGLAVGWHSLPVFDKSDLNIFLLYTYKKNDKRYTKITSRFALKQKCIVSVSIESFTKVNDLSHSPSEHNQ